MDDGVLDKWSFARNHEATADERLSKFKSLLLVRLLMAPRIRIISHNVNGIYGDIFTLQEFLQRKQVDIAKPSYHEITNIFDGQILDTGPMKMQAQIRLTEELQ